jgi:hypothetical protein
MKNFDKFVQHIVNKWRQEKKLILENVGLGGLSNREYGDLAEDFILKRITKLTPKYDAVKSNGSQSPADILACARRNGYWHFMLIQVKSSNDKDNIEKLDADQKKVFDEFCKFLKREISISGHLDDYKEKPIIISNGYAAVLRTTTGHRLIEGKAFKIFKVNSYDLDTEDIKGKVTETHKL